MVERMPCEHVLAAIADQVRRRPDQTALIGIDSGNLIELSWLQLVRCAIARADQFREQERNTQLRVGYRSTNSLDDVVTVIACMVAGCIEFPFDGRLPSGLAQQRFQNQVGGLWYEKPDQTDWQIDAAGVATTISVLDDSIRAADPDDAALVLWTSGTTSQPKGVVLSHRNLIGNAEAKLKAVPQTENDVRLTSLPICHAYARTCDLGTWFLSGCRLVIGDGFSAWRNTKTNVQPTIANVVPSLAERLLQSSDDVGLSKLRLLGCGGAPISAASFLAWQKRGVTVVQGYGLTETSPVICSATPANASAGLVGNFVDGWQHRIDDGRLFVRGPHVMLGYWNDPDATSDRIAPDGWLDTGDLVEVDSDTGQLRILGRADDVIVLPNGHKVHPQSIERKVNLIPGVRHAMVVYSGSDLQLWIDAIESEVVLDDIEVIFQQLPKWERCKHIYRFSRPLSHETGELTAKGTIRREVIAEQQIRTNDPTLSKHNHPHL